ncbi:homeobox protein vent1B-like [Pungitius pungitius]|uniref:homeobox protein vent1B-like n=1 Tax=Pungitius pungitius TaxID=134920 RepID=UPI001886BCD6|nr:homeobox protein vent1B-like [Pungitius pungitius]
MVKYFSVDWLAQSHCHGAPTDEHGAVTESALTCRPHVPCMVQPRPPTFGKGYLQPKPKASKPAEPAERVESKGQDASLCSPFHPTSCASPSPVSEISGYSSGYESEAASSECLSVDEGSDAEKDAPLRRVRTKFSTEQISKLEKIFNKHKYLDAGERVKTAQKLKLTETQVRTWFQNRRMKLKREFQDYLAPQMPPLLFQQLPPVHHYHNAAGQGPHYPAAGPAFYPAPVPQLLLQRQIHPHHQPHPHLIIRNPNYY